MTRPANGAARDLVIGVHIRRGDSCHKGRYCPANLTSSYPPLCFLDLAAVQVLRAERTPLHLSPDGTASSTHACAANGAAAPVGDSASPDDAIAGRAGASASPPPPSKRRRVEASAPHPVWLARLLLVEAAAAASFDSAAAHAARAESMALPPTEETLVVATSNGQLATFPLANLEILKAGESH